MVNLSDTEQRIALARSYFNDTNLLQHSPREGTDKFIAARAMKTQA